MVRPPGGTIELGLEDERMLGHPDGVSLEPVESILVPWNRENRRVDPDVTVNRR